MVRIGLVSKVAGILLISSAVIFAGTQSASAQAQVAIGEVIIGAIAGKLTEYGIDYLKQRVGSSAATYEQESAPSTYYDNSNVDEQTFFAPPQSRAYTQVQDVPVRSAESRAQDYVPHNFHVIGCPQIYPQKAADNTSNQGYVPPGFRLVSDNVPSNWSRAPQEGRTECYANGNGPNCDYVPPGVRVIHQ